MFKPQSFSNSDEQLYKPKFEDSFYSTLRSKTTVFKYMKQKSKMHTIFNTRGLNHYWRSEEAVLKK